MPHSQTIINNQEEPSVTEIIAILNKPYLNRWFGKVGNQEAARVSKEAAELGKDVHNKIEEYLTDGVIASTYSALNNSSQVFDLFSTWVTWWIHGKYDVKALEKKVISKKYLYGGTFDAILLHKTSNTIYLTDWKVSNNEDKFRRLQLAGYAQAYYEEMGEKLINGLIVRIDKNEQKVYEEHISNLWNYVPLFLACRKLYDFVYSRKKFKND